MPTDLRKPPQTMDFETHGKTFTADVTPDPDGGYCATVRGHENCSAKADTLPELRSRIVDVTLRTVFDIEAEQKRFHAKFGLAAAECFSRIYAAELQREKEAHAQTVAEAYHDINELESKLQFSEEMRRYHYRNQCKAEAGQDTLQNVLAKVIKGSQRSDKGKHHRKTPHGWIKQTEVAAHFSINAKKIGGEWYGKVSVEKVKDRETRYPDETKRESKSGYHAGLRNTPNPTHEIKKAYHEAARQWNDYWQRHNEDYSRWREANPKGNHATFLKTWERPGKTVHRSDTDKTGRYGADWSFRDSLDGRLRR